MKRILVLLFISSLIGATSYSDDPQVVESDKSESTEAGIPTDCDQKIIASALTDPSPEQRNQDKGKSNNKKTGQLHRIDSEIVIVAVHSDPFGSPCRR